MRYTQCIIISFIINVEMVCKYKLKNKDKDKIKIDEDEDNYNNLYLR